MIVKLKHPSDFFDMSALQHYTWDTSAILYHNKAVGMY